MYFSWGRRKIPSLEQAKGLGYNRNSMYFLVLKTCPLTSQNRHAESCKCSAGFQVGVEVTCLIYFSAFRKVSVAYSLFLLYRLGSFALVH